MTETLPGRRARERARRGATPCWWPTPPPWTRSSSARCGSPSSPRDLDQLVRALDRLRAGNRVYARLYPARQRGDRRRRVPAGPARLGALGARAPPTRARASSRCRDPPVWRARSPRDRAVSGWRQSLTLPSSGEDRRAPLPMTDRRDAPRCAVLAVARRSPGARAGAAGPQFWRLEGATAFLEGELEGLSLDSEAACASAPATRSASSTRRPPTPGASPATPTGVLYVGTGNDGRVFRVEGEQGLASSSTRTSSRCTRWRWARTGGSTRARRPTERSTRSTPPARPRASSTPPRSTSGPSPSTRRARSTSPPAARAASTGCTPDGKSETLLDHRPRPTSCPSPSTSAGAVFAGSAPEGIVYRIDAAGKVVRPRRLRLPRDQGARRRAPTGAVYAAAIDGQTRRDRAPGPGRGRRPRPAPASGSRGGRGDGQRELRGRRARQPPCAAAGAGGGPGPVEGRAAPDRRLGRRRHAVELRRGRALTPRVRARRGRPRRHGQQGQGLPGRRRRPLGPGRVAPRRAGHRPSPAPGGGAGPRHVEPGAASSRSTTRTATQGHASCRRSRTPRPSSTWGRVSWEGTAPPGTRGAPPDPRRQHGDPRRDLDRLVGALDSRGRRADGDRAGRASSSSGSPSSAAKAARRPTVEAVAAAYLQRNLPPVVKSITVHPPGEVFQKPISVSGEPEILGLDVDPLSERAAAQRARRRQPARHQLQPQALPARPAHLLLAGRGPERRRPALRRRVPDGGRRALAAAAARARRSRSSPGTPRSVPNGRYVVRVLASDAPGNPPDARPDRLEGQRLLPGRQRPALDRGVARPRRRPRASGSRCRTTRSPVRRLEFSVDAGRWQEVHPADGITDSLEETYEIPLPAAVADPASSSCGRRDLLGNVATARVDMPCLGRALDVLARPRRRASGTCCCCAGRSRPCGRPGTPFASSRPRAPGRALARHRERAEVDAVLAWDGPEVAALLGRGGAAAGASPRPSRARGRRGRVHAERAPGRGAARRAPRASSPTTPLPPPAARTLAPGWPAPCEPLGLDPAAEPPRPLACHRGRATRTRRERTRDLPPGFLAVHPGSGSPAKNWPRGALRRRGPAGSLAGRPGCSSSAPPRRKRRRLERRVVGPRAGRCARSGPRSPARASSSATTPASRHLAAAAGAPTLALFGPTDPATWAPVGPAGRDAARAGRRRSPTSSVAEVARGRRASSQLRPRRADLHPADQPVDAHRDRAAAVAHGLEALLAQGLEERLRRGRRRPASTVTPATEPSRATTVSRNSDPSPAARQDLGRERERRRCSRGRPISAEGNSGLASVPEAGRLPQAPRSEVHLGQRAGVEGEDGRRAPAQQDSAAGTRLGRMKGRAAAKPRKSSARPGAASRRRARAASSTRAATDSGASSRGSSATRAARRRAAPPPASRAGGAAREVQRRPRGPPTARAPRRATRESRARTRAHAHDRPPLLDQPPQPAAHRLAGPREPALHRALRDARAPPPPPRR